jgi:hypothetical protein
MVKLHSNHSAIVLHYLEFYVIMLNITDDFLCTREQKVVALRLSRHQINRLMSSIWTQSISPENMPANYEAIALTYSLVLLVSRAKVITVFMIMQFLELRLSTIHLYFSFK